MSWLNNLNDIKTEHPKSLEVAKDIVKKAQQTAEPFLNLGKIIVEVEDQNSNASLPFIDAPLRAKSLYKDDTRIQLLWNKELKKYISNNTTGSFNAVLAVLAVYAIQDLQAKGKRLVAIEPDENDDETNA